MSKFANIIKKKPEEILGHPDYSLDEVGGLRIADEAASELKKDEVTLTVKCRTPDDDNFISLGLINWSE